MRISFAAILAGALATSLALADDNDNLEKLSGDWSVITVDHHGRKFTEDERSRPLVTFKGNQMTVKDNGAIHPGTFRIDPNATPAQIDVTPSAGPNKDKTFQGIYQLDGDQLKLCVREKGAGRPIEFKGGEGLLFVTMKRGK